MWFGQNISNTVLSIFAVYASSGIPGSCWLNLILNYLSYFFDHLQSASADLIAKVNLHIFLIPTVMDEAPSDDGLKALFYQKGIGGKLILVVQVDASLMGLAELVVYRYEFPVGSHQVV